MDRTEAETRVAALAALAGVRLPPDDLAPLAEALSAHLAAMEPLLAGTDWTLPALLTHDPRWRGT